MRTKRFSLRYLPLLLCLIPFLILQISCSQGIPSIRSTVVQVLKVQGPSLTFAERLSVFVFFDDPDGTGDFLSITVRHDSTGLLWTITSDTASVRLRGRDRWTGSANLAGPGDAPIPEGSYTLTVSDLAGNEAESHFTVSPPDFPDRAPVVFTVGGDSWNLVRNADAPLFFRTYLLMYDGKGTLLYSWLVPDGKRARIEGTVASLLSISREAVSIRCYTENETATAGVLLTPVNLR